MLALALMLGTALGPVRAQDAPAPRADGLGGLARALALVAAADGAEAADALAGPRLPAPARRALRDLAAAPRARDVRDMAGDDEAQADLLPALLADVPAARAALEAFAADAEKHLARDLAGLEAAIGELGGAADALAKDAQAEQVASRRAAAEREHGPQVLALAAGAPLSRAALAAARDPVSRLEALARQVERRHDALALAALDVGGRVLRGAAPRLRATGDGGRLEALLAAAARQLEAAAARLEAATRAAVDAARALRDEELARVTRQQRGPELADAMRMSTAYRRAFQAPPSLRAHALPDVYEDRATARVLFWLDGEDRWAQGGERVDPLEPIVEALLGSPDPALRARAVDARALSRLYGLFERPFAEGLGQVLERTRDAGLRLAAARTLAERAGVTALDLDAALERRAGVVPALAGPGARDALLSVTVEQGPDAGRALAAALVDAADALARLRVVPAVVELEGAGDAPVDLVWTPAEGDRAWLVPPPRRLAAGARGAGGLLAVDGDAQQPPAVSKVSVAAWASTPGGQVLAGRAAVDAQGARLRLEPAPGPSIVARPEGDGLGVQLLPAGAALRLDLVRGDARRALPPVLGGAFASALPGEAGGAGVIVATDEAGAERARLAVELPATRGVVVQGDGDGPWWVTPGGRIEARVLEGGKPLAGRHAFQIEGEGGGAVVTKRTAETLRWEAAAPPGRYRVLVEGARPAPLVVADGPPRLVAVVDPRRASPAPAPGAPPAALRAGAGGFLRLDAWPVLVAEEVRRVTWTIEGVAAPAETRASLASPDAVLLLPVWLDAAAKPGPRKVTARCETDRGVLEVTGRLDVGPAAAPLALGLRGADGDPLRAVAQGEAAVLDAGPALRDATWLALSPAGRVRTLAPRFDGRVPLALLPHDLPGAWRVWAHGARADGTIAAGRLEVLVHPPATATVRAPAVAGLGETVGVDVEPPPGFTAPYRVRREGGPWQAGTRLEVGVQATTEVALVLEDAAGRRARGSATIRGERVVEGTPGGAGAPRFGVVANTTQRRLFAAEYDLLQAYRRNDNLPRDWVVVEPGPLTAAKVRDRMFQTLPYDGAAQDPQVAFRTKRFWPGLTGPARQGLLDRGVPDGETFEVLDSPAPQGEETLDALVARHVAEHGAWEFRLVRVRVVKADGATPDPAAPRDRDDELRLFRVGTSAEGRALERVEVPGPLGSLGLRPSLPATIRLGQPARMAVAALGVRAPLVPGRRYPGGWESTLPQALLATEVEVEVDFEGRSRARASAQRVGRDVAGAELALLLEHLGPEPAPGVAGAPRRAERYRLVLDTFGPGAPAPLDVRFDPIPPGLLDNVPRTLVVTLRARLRPAVPPGAWPAGRPRPEATEIDDAPFLLGAPELPEPSIEVQATYMRVAPDGPKTWPALVPPLAAVSPGGPPPAPLDAAGALADAEAALVRRDADAAALAARRAVFATPDDPAAWAVFADAALLRRRPAEAAARARWSLGLAPSARAHVVLGEALVEDGRTGEAAEAVKAAAELRPTGALAERLERLRGQLE